MCVCVQDLLEQTRYFTPKGARPGINEDRIDGTEWWTCRALSFVGSQTPGLILISDVGLILAKDIEQTSLIKV